MYDKSLGYKRNTQTLISTKKRTLVDQETGEVIEVDQVTKIAYGQKNFWKVYLFDFLQVLGILESKQLDVLIYVLENTNSSNNTFIGTHKKIAEKTNTSRDTIHRTFKKLQDAKFLEKIQNGVYQVSPLIMMKGSDYKKQLLLNYYKEDDNNKDNNETKK